ncbi:MAG TPA: cyclic nucleotide-binding domain-containing protein [Myxococcales bacterium]
MRGTIVTAADRHEALRGAALFRDFTEVGLRILAEMSVSRQVGRGAYAFRAGEPSRELSVLVRGSLQLVGRDGGPPLGEVMPGDTFGGLTLLSASEHLVSALAATEVELVQLSRDSFEDLQRTRPRTALKLTLALARDLTERLQDARAPLREFLVWQISKRQTEPR